MTGRTSEVPSVITQKRCVFGCWVQTTSQSTRDVSFRGRNASKHSIFDLILGAKNLKEQRNYTSEMAMEAIWQERDLRDLCLHLQQYIGDSLNAIGETPKHKLN